MSCQTTIVLGNNLTFAICTHDPDTGVLTDADGAPAYRLYEDETGAAILTGTMAKLDDANTTGFYSELIACTTGNGFEIGKSYNIYITATVDSDPGGISYGFTVEAATADAVWDEALAGHDVEDSIGNVVNDLVEESGGTYRFTSSALGQAPTGGAGSGAITFTYTLTSSVDSSAIVDADVWVTSDQAGNNLLASGSTNSNGQVTFYLDAGTVYVWRQKPGFNFDNPDTETVA